METPKPTNRVRLVIAYNNCAAHDPCAICGAPSDPSIPLAIFLQEDPARPVCDQCAREHAPELVLLLNSDYYIYNIHRVLPDHHDEHIQSLLVQMDARHTEDLRTGKGGCF